MWALIFLVTSMNSLSITTSHVDSFISHKLCEAAGKEVQARFKERSSNVDYACVLEIN